MNKNQRNTLVAGFAVIVLMGIFPPWRGFVTTTKVSWEQNARYSFLFAPPKKGLLDNGYEPEFPYREPSINLPLLITQWGVVTASTGIAFLFLDNRKVA